MAPLNLSRFPDVCSLLKAAASQPPSLPLASILPGRRSGARRWIKQSFETGTPWEDTFPLRGRDGSYRWFLSRALPIRDEAGNVIRWFGTTRHHGANRGGEGAART